VEKIELYIEEGQTTDVIIYMGDPTAPIEYPILSEYIESTYSVNTSSAEELWSLIKELGLIENDDLEKEKHKSKPEDFLGKLGDPLDPESWFAEQYLDWEYDSNESPAARMFHFLNDSVYDRSNIKLIEGDRPGSNFTYCQAENLKVISALIEELRTHGIETSLKKFNW
jgi:hypothetical protein